MKYLNVVGPQIRRLRYQRGWSQAQLAVRLQLQGWDFDRGGVAKIESGIHQVSDTQLLYFAHVLGVSVKDLLPPIHGSLHKSLEPLLTPRPRLQPAPRTEQPPPPLSL